jgi:hypothetical protein
MGERRDAYRILVGGTEGGHLEEVGLDGILKWIFKKCDGENGMD